MKKRELTPDMTLGDVVATYPATMPMLESLGIDFCCGGKRPLDVAANEAKIPLETVLAVLRTTILQSQMAPSDSRDWQTVPLDELIEHIVEKHHTFMHRELPHISEMMGRVQRAHGDHHGAMLTPLAAAYAALRKELEKHLAEEEDPIFPTILRVVAGERGGAAIAAISQLENEHEAAGELLAQMRSLTSNYQLPADACNTFRMLYETIQEMEVDLHEHISLENNILFPRTRALLAE